MHYYPSLFLVALTTLAYEIALTRLLSVISWYHLGFLAISVAMLGMTVGAIVVFLSHRAFTEQCIGRTLRWVLVAFALSLPLAAVVICEFSIPMVKSASGVLKFLPGLSLIVLVASLPFLCSGVFISACLTRLPLPVSKLYASDLLGAAMGCLVILGLMSLVDTPTGILLIALLPIGAIILLQEKPRLPLVAVQLMGCLLVAVALLSLDNPLLSPKVVKGRIEDKSTLDFERWNSFSRVEVRKEKLDIPFLWGADRALLQENGPVYQRPMKIDGEAGTTMYRFQQPADIAHLQYDVTSFAHILRPGSAVAVIGVGGGKDLQAAVWYQQPSITGIELNPIFVDLIENQYAEFAGLAGRPELTLVVDEARSYLSASHRQFDVLQMSLIDTWAATGAGAFSLSENGLYTTEAWNTFMDRLSERGIFTVSRWFAAADLGETARMVSLAMATMIEREVKNPGQHIALVTNGFVATLLVANSAYSQQDLAAIGAAAKSKGHRVAILPGEVPDHPLLAGILRSESTAELLAVASASALNIAPPTDQSPYFFNMLRLGNLSAGQGLGVLNAGVIAGNLTATYTLLGLIAALSGLSILLIFGPLVLKLIGSRGAGQIAWLPCVYFGLIGAGFMAAEIGLLQYLSVFLGHPVYGLGVLLFAIIASTGLGSYLSGFTPLREGPQLLALSGVMAVLILVVEMILSHWLSAWIVLPIISKIAIAIALVTPLGLLLGFFFPTGMELVDHQPEDATPWFWAVNGFFGVLAAAVATFTAIYVGISANFYAAALLYSLTAPCLLLMARRGRGT